MSVDWWDVAVRLAAAVCFGGIVGFERDVEGQDAGVRTHMLLALGAAVFGVISVSAFDPWIGDPSRTNVTVDVSRVASYVAAGVGFLGSGAIVKGADRVHGLTTAASLWSVAAIGLAAGLGFWPAAIAGTVLALIVLVAERPLQSLAARIRRTSRQGPS